MKQLLVILALSLALVPPASAQQPLADADRVDLQCVVLYNDFGNALTNPSEDELIGVSSLIGYFIGKIFARTPGFDLQSAVTSELMASARAMSQADHDYCAREAKEFSARISAVAPILDN